MARPQPRYKPGDRIGGRYQVHKALMGGMGEVYLCLDLEEMLPYALKTFQQRYQSTALRQAFEQEVATWVAMEKHPNIVRCFYMDILDNQPFMVLEWIAGEEGKGADLRGWLRHGPLELRTALEITLDIVRGLVHAQEKRPGLVHRDLKPENILVAQGGLAKITDFGLAQIVEQAGLELAEAEAKAESRPSMISKGGIAGTPAYMAPEQWRGENLDERTDIYAVGCILYEMLTGQWPFRAEFTPTTPQRLQEWLSVMQNKHENSLRPTLPLALPGELNELVGTCLSQVRADRPARLAIVLEDLSELYRRQFKNSPPAQLSTTTFAAGDYLNRGLTYANLQQYERALIDYERAITLNPEFAEAYNNRGNAYAKLGRYEVALADFERAITLNPDYVNAYNNRGNTYDNLQQYEQALADYRRVITLNPDYVGAYNNRGLTRYKLQQYEQALVDFNQAIALNPDDATAYNNRGNTYHKLQQDEAALADLNRAIALNPNYAEAYYNRGSIYDKLRLYDQALADYRQAIALNPEFAEAYYNRGNIYYRVQQYEHALADYGRAITLNPDYAKAYYNRGVTYDKLQQYEQALADYGQAITLNPDYAEAYNNRGAIYHKLRRYEQALADYGRAIALNPHYTEAYINRANIYTPLQHYEQALADYQQAIALNPDEASAYFNLGAILTKRGRLRESLLYFEQAARLGYSGAHQAIAQIQQKLDEAPLSPQIDQVPQAFESFQQTISLEAMRQTAAHFPFMTQANFVAAIEQFIAQRVLQEDRPYFEQRLGWLKQIANDV